MYRFVDNRLLSWESLDRADGHPIVTSGIFLSLLLALIFRRNKGIRIHGNDQTQPVAYLFNPR